MSKDDDSIPPLIQEAPTWTNLWKGMPEFRQRDLTPWQSVKIHFKNKEDRDAFAKLLGRTITDKTQCLWYPPAEIGRYADKAYAADSPKLPRYPVFIPSKGRADTRMTMRAFDKIGIPYFVVVEPQEFDLYKVHIPKSRLIVTPHQNKGVVVTRNFIWDYAQKIGCPRYWTFDDNIKAFYRLNKNLKTPVADGTMFYAIEDFVERYENIAIAGCQYFMFASRKTEMPPFILNTRVYSNMLIKTDLCDNRGKSIRWEGFYNEDTDLCLRILKLGQCLLLFNAFLIEKSVTMSVRGGNTGNYTGDGRYKMAKELALKHPDCVTITEKWGRAQHQVNYKKFRRNRLIPKEGVEIPEGVEDFGMEFEVLDEG